MITLPALPYQYNALVPFIDEETMRIHHTKHHQAYIDKLNLVLEKYPLLQSDSVDSLLQKLETLPMEPKDKIQLNNNGGGHSNHTFFWSIMGTTKHVDPDLSKKITATFGSVDAFKKAFTEGALQHFGSGWMWLVENSNKELLLYSTPNQNSPHLSGHTPKITLDLWEHAYYLAYQNRKADYIKNWWNVVSVI